MKISELAKQSGLSTHTLRYYEKLGLFQPSFRNNSNYRIYSDDDLTTAKFIQRCKSSGFFLQETAKLISIREDKDQHICAEAKAITKHKIGELTDKIEALTAMVATLKQLDNYCIGGQKSAEFCSIISSLEEI